MDKKYDIVGVGSAIVDVISYRDEDFIAKYNLHKDATTIVSKEDMDLIYADMGASTECSGGNAANIIVGAEMLGANNAFISTVNNDYGGKVFRKSLEKNNVTLHDPNIDATHETAHCLIILTEEENPISKKNLMSRTMAVYLGKDNHIDADDVDEELIASSKLLLIEGFLCDIPSGKQVIEKSLEFAKQYGVEVAFCLSDKLCVRRNRDYLLEIITNNVDILFTNYHEAQALFDCVDQKSVMYGLSEFCKNNRLKLISLTNGEKGSYLLTPDEIHSFDAVEVSSVYDVTGAGDLYASGILYGYINDMSVDECGLLASKCAAEVIKYLGARPVTDLKRFLK